MVLVEQPRWSSAGASLSRRVMFFELPWQAQALTILAGIFAVVGVFALVFAGVATGRASGHRGPFVALLLAVLFFFLQQVLTLAAYIVTIAAIESRDLIYDLSAAAGAFGSWSDAVLLLALFLVMANRSSALRAMTRQKGSVGAGRIVVWFIFVVLMVAGLVNPILVALTAHRDNYLTGDDLRSRQAAIDSLRRLSLGLYWALTLGLTIYVAVLRKRIGSIGLRDRPVNTVAFVALPMLYIQGGWYIFSELWTEVNDNYNNLLELNLAVVGTVISSVAPAVIFFAFAFSGMNASSWNTFGDQAEAARQSDKMQYTARGEYVHVEQQPFYTPHDPYQSQPQPPTYYGQPPEADVGLQAVQLNVSPPSPEPKAVPRV